MQVRKFISKKCWFKNLASSSNDPKMVALEKVYPIYGYALYFKFKEKAAGSIDKPIWVDALSMKLMYKNFDGRNLTSTKLMDIIRLMDELNMICFLDDYIIIPKI